MRLSDATVAEYIAINGNTEISYFFFPFLICWRFRDENVHRANGWTQFFVRLNFDRRRFAVSDRVHPKCEIPAHARLLRVAHALFNRF